VNFKYRNNLSDVTLEVVDINDNQTPCGDEKRVDSIYITSINLSDCQGSRSHNLSVRIEITAKDTVIWIILLQITKLAYFHVQNENFRLNFHFLSEKDIEILCIL
jgi:hypothetical protein